MGGKPGETGYIADYADSLLKADKMLAGAEAWAEGNRPGERRLTWPVLVNGELVGVHLCITAYPASAPLRFTIGLNVPPCIWRLDYDPPFKRHRNPLADGARLGAYVITGPHYHAWPDNRHFATPGTLPRKLECARELPRNIQTFHAGLRWFCGETNIKIPSGPLIDLPAREKLI